MPPTRKCALVTGSSRGIGRAIAERLAADGFDLVINYNANAAAAEDVRAAVVARGARAVVVRADVSDAAGRAALLAAARDAFGGVDLLVNNAGIAPTVRADILAATEESFDRLIDVNLKGPYFLTQLVAADMVRRASENPTHAMPMIITITSVSAYAASANRGDYCVAKAGLSMMTKLFAARLAEFGINVYEIRPGVIETDMTGPVKARYDELIFHGDLTPLKRWGTPDDVARAVSAVAGNLLPFSTGEVLNVDGGFHLRRL